MKMLVPLTLLVLWTLPAALFAQPTESFDILLTNDDGIESPGIQVLAEKLAEVGRVHLVAPCGQRSGSSMAVDLRAELELRPIRGDGRMPGHCVDATPAGAVLLAITTLAPDGGFDLVVSGINRGANIGAVAHMSGTVGGAMAGAYFGIPAVAASLGRGRDFDYPARFVASFVGELKRRPARPGIVFSINIPSARQEEIAGVVSAPMGGSQLRFGYDETAGEGETRHFRPRISRETDFPAGSDTEAFAAGRITITPLRFDWTAFTVVDELKTWNLRHELP